MSKWKTLKQQLIEALGAVLEPLGFDYLPKLNQYRKTTDDGFLNLLWSFSDYPDVCILEFHAGLRINAVEEMAFPFTNGLKSFQTDSHTLVASIGRLKGKRFERFSIATEQDLTSIIQAFQEDLEEVVKPFWEHYQKLEHLSQLFNFPKEEQLLLVPNWHHAPLRGVVLAKLLNRPNFTAIVQKHSLILKELATHDLLKERFGQLVIYLQEMSFN